jgi:hypothetical protein
VSNNFSPLKKKKKQHVTKCYTRRRTWTDSLERPWQRKMDTRFGAWNLKSLFRPCLLKTISSEIATRKLDLVRWDRDDGETADDCTFFYDNGSANHQLGTVFFVYQGITLADKTVEFFSDRMLYIILTNSAKA